MMNTEQYTNNPQTQQTMQNHYNQAKQQNLGQKHGDRRIKEACLKIAARQNQDLLQNLDNLKYYNRLGLSKSERKIARAIDQYPPQYKITTHVNRLINKDTEDTFTLEHIENARHLAKQIENNQKLIGKSPSGIAAAILYIAGILSDNYKTTHEIVELSDISEPTLRKTHKIIVEELDLINEFLNHHPYPTRTTWSKNQ